MRSTHIEKMIQQLYQNISIANPDCMDIETIANKMNIDLFFWDEEAEAVCYKGKCRILLDDRISRCRQKKEFACQILQVLRHRSSKISPAAKETEYHKIKESVFAEHFCVPSFMLKKMALPNDRKEAVQIISQVFRVDSQMAEDRLEYLYTLRHA